MAFFTEFLALSNEMTSFEHDDLLSSGEDVAYAKSFWQSIQLNPPVESTLTTQKVTQRVKTNKSSSTHNTVGGSVKSHALVPLVPLGSLSLAPAMLVPRVDSQGQALPEKLLDFYSRVQQQRDDDRKEEVKKWQEMKDAEIEHMSERIRSRKDETLYIHDSLTRPPTSDAINARLNELPPELEDAGGADADIDGTRDDVIAAVRNLPP